MKPGRRERKRCTSKLKSGHRQSVKPRQRKLPRRKRRFADNAQVRERAETQTELSAKHSSQPSWLKCDRTVGALHEGAEPKVFGVIGMTLEDVRSLLTIVYGLAEPASTQDAALHPGPRTSRQVLKTA
jgi:hypothetical protein